MNIPIPIRYSLTILIVGALIWFAGPKNVLEQLQMASLPWIVFCAIAMLLAILPGVFGLSTLVLPLRHLVPFKALTRAFAISWSLGTLLPGRLGTLSVITLLTPFGITIGQGTALFFLDKFITLTLLIVVSIVGMFYIFGEFIGLVGIIISIAALLIAALVLYTPIGRRIIRSFFLRGHERLFYGFFATTKSYITKHPESIFKNYIWTVIKLAADSLVIWGMFNALGITLPFFVVVIVYSATAVLSFVPITISGLGFREGAAVVLFAPFDIGASIVISAYLLIYALSLAISGVIILFYIKTENLSIADILRIPKK